MPDTVPKPEHEFLNAPQRTQARLSFPGQLNKANRPHRVLRFVHGLSERGDGPAGGLQALISTVSEDRGRPQNAERHERPDRRPRPGRKVP